jgi:adenosylcobinamide-phosphate synthase
LTPDPLTLLASATALPVAATALLIERLLGYPNGLQDWIGHPVEWIGKLIGVLDSRFNGGESRKLKGVATLLIVIGVFLVTTVPLTLWLRSLGGGWMAEALLASTLLSQKSLEDHVRAVADGLATSLAHGRKAVSRIVGRDPGTLDESGVTKGAIESLAENMSDGVTAPLFWLLVAGLPGAALYKAVNTADSMIGHHSEKYRDFGWASARLDDLANIVPARVTGWIIVLTAAIMNGTSGRGAAAAMARDAKRHVSPNAGWPESALAGALTIRLGGPRSYEGHEVDLAWMGNGRENLELKDISEGLRLYGTGLNLLTLMVVIACIISWTA